MSEEADKAEAASKRKTLTMGDRTKVIDFLRSRVEPVSADSNQAIASLVSEGSKVDINWQQLKYMIEDESMAEWKLGEKIHLKVSVNSEDDRSIALESRISKLETHAFSVDQSGLSIAKGVSELADIVSKLTDRIIALEAK